MAAWVMRRATRSALVVGEGGDGGAAAGEVGGGGAGFLRGGHDRVEAGEDLGADGLVDAVLRGLVEEVVAAGAEGGDEQGDAADVEDCCPRARAAWAAAARFLQSASRSRGRRRRFRGRPVAAAG